MTAEDVTQLIRYAGLLVAIGLIVIANVLHAKGKTSDGVFLLCMAIVNILIAELVVSP